MPKGFMLFFTPHQMQPAARELTGEPPLEDIKAGIGGGWIEAVPGFTSIVHEGERFPCVAFCDEDGKGKDMPVNFRATVLWDEALRKTGHPGLIDTRGAVADYLVGPVVVLAGDDEFMRSLREDCG